MPATPSVLFVCLGNICRSPMAEGAFRQLAQAARIPVECDSAGTGNWHVGEAPDLRAQAAVARNGGDISGARARQVRLQDFYDFTHIIALDSTNLRDLKRLRPSDATADLSLLLDHVPGRAGQAVADPYYGDAAGFDVTWQDVAAGAKALLAKLA